MKKRTLGICLPYYKNTQQCEEAFKELMKQIDEQLTSDMLVCIYEDGQESDWLKEYSTFNVEIMGSKINRGVSYARNQCIDFLINKVDYILFVDTDDRLSDDYLDVMWKYCADKTHEFVESSFTVNDQPSSYNSKLVRCGVAGTAIQTKIIGDLRFEEKLQIGEDTKFMNEICDLSKYRKRHAPTCYFYQLGINNDSLTMKHAREEISKERE